MNFQGERHRAAEQGGGLWFFGERCSVQICPSEESSGVSRTELLFAREMSRVLFSPVMLLIFDITGKIFQGSSVSLLNINNTK